MWVPGQASTDTSKAQPSEMCYGVIGVPEESLLSKTRVCGAGETIT